MEEIKGHPLEKFRYCPVCGEDGFKIDTFKSKRCEKCGFVYFYNSSGSVPVIIKNKEGKYLFVRRKYEPKKGTLDLPGGFIDYGETAETCAVREVKEETGLDINENQLQYLFSIPNPYNYSNFIVTSIDMYFTTSVDSFDHAIPGDDAQELVILDKSQINLSLFGFPSTKKALTKLFNL